ncbi:MAG: glycoside hydrolase family 38 C-terminal domain-containing protein, partial [Planctomycetota bacterium]
WWRIELPTLEGRHYLRWDDEGEATLYRRHGDGWTPHHGIDPGHLEVPLPEGETTLLIESICCRTGVWVAGGKQGLSPEGSLFRGASVLRRNDDAWHAWHDLDILLGLCDLLYRQALPRPYSAGAGNDIGQSSGELFNSGGYRTPVEAAPPILRQILRKLTSAADAYDRSGAAAFREKTSAILADLPAEPQAINATLTGHAHIDLAWLWPERVGDFKAVHSFATAEHLMGEYPELHFGYSQPASYEAVERRAPELIDRVKARIGEGNWEATGAMYVESDTQLPCGEALVRAIALGQAGFESLSGDASRVLWLPDVFGYSACLPQLLSGFDVPYFFTTKMHWSGGTRFPHSAFEWQSYDGSSVLGFIAWEHYNLSALPSQLDWAAMNQRQSDVFPDTLACTGYGDGGGGVTATMCERTRRMNNLATLPKSQWGRIDGFFDRMALVRDELPTWQGEMYLEYHRGVQTTHVELKQAYRAAERGLQLHEAARCIVGDGPMDDADWKRVCFAQFHDILPGSSIQEVYGETNPELQSIADRQTQAAIERLGGEGDSVFNPLPCERAVVLDGKPRLVPPLCVAKLDSLEALPAEPVRAEGTTLDNGRVRVTFDDAGGVSSMSVDGHAVVLAGSAGRLFALPDAPANYDAWDIDRHTLSAGELVDTPVELHVEGDDGRRTVRVSRSVGQKSRVELSFSLSVDSPVLEIESDIDWQDEQTLLKMVWPTEYRVADVLYGAPYGSTSRSQTGNTIADDAAFEVPASRWAAIGDTQGGDGLMLVTEASYGMGARDGLLHVSLVRSAMITRADEDVQLRDFDAYGQDGHQAFSDIGRHRVRLAVGRFDPASERHEQPAQLADLLFTPVLRTNGTPANAGLLGIDGVPSVTAAWAKPEPDGWTLRLHETLGRRGTLTLRLADGVTATRTDLRGH